MGENQKTQQVSFWARPWYMIGGTALEISNAGVGLYIANGVRHDYAAGYYASLEDAIIVAGFFLFLALVSIGILFACSSKLYVKVTLDETGIITKSGLKKAVVRPYSDYHYIYRGWYWHGSGGFGKNVYYIVLSHRRLSDKQLQQINLVANDGDTVILKYTAERLRKLLAILPREQRYSLKASFHREVKANNIEV